MTDGSPDEAGIREVSGAADAAGHTPGTNEPAVSATPAVPVRRKGRRVTTEPVPGTDPNPAAEEPRHTLEENDDRLKAEKPPHY